MTWTPILNTSRTLDVTKTATQEIHATRKEAKRPLKEIKKRILSNIWQLNEKKRCYDCYLNIKEHLTKDDFKK
jgi:hypothetical protein